MMRQGTQPIKGQDAMKYQIDREIWSRLTIVEQMGSMHPVIQQAIRAYHEQDHLLFARSLEEALGMFDATVEIASRRQAKGAIKEVLMAKNEFLRLFYLEHSPKEEASLERYFAYFAHAAEATK